MIYTNTSKLWTAVLAAAVFTLCTGIGLAAATKESLKKNFEARHPKILTLKTIGKVGETSKGFLEPVKVKFAPASKEQKMIEAENGDRSKLYAILAKEQNTTVEEVGRQNAIFKFKKAGLDDYFKGKVGTWRQKKEMLKK